MLGLLAILDRAGLSTRVAGSPTLNRTHGIGSAYRRFSPTRDNEVDGLCETQLRRWATVAVFERVALTADFTTLHPKP